MKHLFSFFALFITLQLAAQADYRPVQILVKDYAHFWSTPGQMEKLNTRGSGLVFTHKLDSVVAKNAVSAVIYKTEMEYDAQGYTTKLRQYGIDSLTSLLRLESAYTFEYETPGYVSHIVGDGINEETQVFEKQLEMDIKYNASNQVDSVIISIEDPFFGGGFGPFLSVKQVYNGDLLLQSRQWINVPLLGGWLLASITDLQYDLNDRLTDQLVTSADFLTGEFAPDARTTYAYNAQGLQETVTEYDWVDPTWVPTQRFIYTYYANETLHNETRQIYSNGNWDNNVWTTYPVEEVNDQFPYTSYIWDPVNAVWNETDSTISFLNPALPWDQVAAPTQLSVLDVLGGESTVNITEGSSILETRFFFVDALSQEFYFDNREIYYYSLLEGSSVNSVLPEYLSVSPNPAQDQFTIGLDLDAKATYTILTMFGVAVERGDMNEGMCTIQTSGWLPGIYFVQIQLSDGSVYVHKQMIE